MFASLFSSPKIIRFDGNYAIHRCPICGIEEVETRVYNGPVDLDLVENNRITRPNICENCLDDNRGGIWCNICRRFKFSDSPCECS